MLLAENDTAAGAADAAAAAAAAGKAAAADGWPAELWQQCWQRW